LAVDFLIGRIFPSAIFCALPHPKIFRPGLYLFHFFTSLLLNGTLCFFYKDKNISETRIKKGKKQLEALSVQLLPLQFKNPSF
jgi:hypothetical protein